MNQGRTVVFLGPTMAANAASKILDATYQGPAKRGDVVAAVRDGMDRIALIDGCFCDVPAVTHKEILWALDQGVGVSGASSFGALRAAELFDFGMVGVGRIFDDYRTGLLTDDDDVAIQHGPAELGYVPTSEAMVNIRATVVAARQAGIFGDAADGVLKAAKARHYPERVWPGILDDALAAGENTDDIERFRAWVSGGKVDQKEEDAMALFRWISGQSDKHPNRRARPRKFPLTEHLAGMLREKRVRSGR